MVLKWIDKFCDRAFAVVGALALTQTPAFFQQYIQQLSGRSLELKHQVEVLKGIAALSKKTLPQYISKFIESGDSDFASQGQLIQYIVNRYDTLQTSWEAMQQASVWTRPYVFVKNMQWDIVQATLADFHPAFTLTTEGLCYAFVGLLLGYSFYAILKRFVRLLFRKERRQDTGDKRQESKAK